MEEQCLITVILPIIITGSKGNRFPFVPATQYCYVEKGMYPRECFEPGCGPLGIYDREGYVVDINDEYFVIWKENVVEGTEVLTEREQAGFGKQYVDHIKFDHPKDHKKLAKEVLGIDIKKNERTDYNGRWLEGLLK
jgi:hypothetical protein